MEFNKFGDTGAAIVPNPSKTLTLSEIQEATRKKEEQDRALKQADELESRRLESAKNLKTPLTQEVMLDPLKDPEVELRRKEALAAMATDPGVKAREAAASVPASVDKYQKDIEEKRFLPDNGVQKYQDTIEAGRVKAAQETEARNLAAKSPTDAATEIANTPPSKIDEVITKLKEEEKKGGPNFFDVIEAAAAGWNGKVPLYVQKAVKAKEQEENLQLMQKQEEAQKAERLASYAQERQLQQEAQAADVDLYERKLASDRALAGLAPIAPIVGTGGLSLGEFSAFGGK